MAWHEFSKNINQFINLLSASLLPQTGGQSDGTFFENKKNFHLCTLIRATMLVFGGV